MINNWLTIIFMIGGALFMLIAAIGIIRLPDIYTRIQAGTKPPSLGIFLLLTAAIFHFGSWILLLQAIFIIMIIFLTTPLAAHMIGSAAHMLNSPKHDKEMRDDLQKELDNMNRIK